MTPNPSAEGWSSADDDEVLETWRMALDEVLSCGRFAGIHPDEQARGLDFDGAGVAVVMALFLARSEGIAAAELRAMIRDGATADLSPDVAAPLATWVLRIHGEETGSCADPSTGSGDDRRGNGRCG